jgi:hypothetical protein
MVNKSRNKKEEKRNAEEIIGLRNSKHAETRGDGIPVRTHAEIDIN